MEKIEKLEEFNWVSGRDAITIALCNTIIRKQNEIIDYLNSQSQPEEKGWKTATAYTGDPIEETTTTSSKDTPEEYSTTVEPLEKNRIYRGVPIKDTPEEWEKRFDKRYDQYNPINDDGTQVATWCGSDYEDMKSFISELLSEREREVLRGLLDDHYDPNSDSIEIDVSEIQSELSKLTTK